jgi:cyclopropane-fatty-acyl-phospholipid synthase
VPVTTKVSQAEVPSYTLATSSITKASPLNTQEMLEWASAARGVFFKLLDECITDSRIHFRIGALNYRVGAKLNVGPDATQSEVVIRVHRERFFSRVLSYNNLGLGEAYMDGDFEVEQGELHEFLTTLLRNRLGERIRQRPRLALRVLGIRLANAFRGGNQNIAAHYDLGDDLFEKFLDSNLVYSCGYAENTSDDLEQLQFNKLDRICRKMRLAPGQSLLDIGCGYGGLLIHAAKHYGAQGFGITNSRAHMERARANVARHGLTGQIRIEQREFQHLESHSSQAQFDRVVSVGMLEHVPRAKYKQYFRTIASMLQPRGMGLVHCIGCNSHHNEHDPFIQKHIFPGSNQPRLSEMALHLEKSGLPILDVENIVRHYGYTVLHWLRHFRANQQTLDPVKYGGAFRKMWEYYLHCGIAAAFASDSAVYQVLFTKDYTAPIPLQRV